MKILVKPLPPTGLRAKSPKCNTKPCRSPVLSAFGPQTAAPEVQGLCQMPDLDDVRGIQVCDGARHPQQPSNGPNTHLQLGNRSRDDGFCVRPGQTGVGLEEAPVELAVQCALA